MRLWEPGETRTMLLKDARRRLAWGGAYTTSLYYYVGSVLSQELIGSETHRFISPDSLYS